MKNIAVFVDGENVSHIHAGTIAAIAARHGEARILRVYGNAAKVPKWGEAAGYRLIHSGSGKNATDVLMAIQAIEFALSKTFEAVLLASSDRDFSHVAIRLRELGLHVFGVGDPKAPESFRRACHSFECLGPAPAPVSHGDTIMEPPNAPSELDKQLRATIAANSKGGSGMRIADLGPVMHGQFKVRISTHPEKTWRGYLSARRDLYDLDPKGPEAKVRFRPAGFATAL